MRTDCLPPCPPTCAGIFRRVFVRPAIAGGTFVQWQFSPDFADPPPHRFQLQYAPSPTADDHEWVDVGLEAADAYFLIDDEQRDRGSLLRAHYRIRLRTPRGTYFSPPQSALDGLPWSLWRQWRAQLAYQRRRLMVSSGVPGRFYKRRIAGAPCTHCRPDMLTGEVLQPQCQQCFGTGFLGGYYQPVSCHFVQLRDAAHFPHQDPNRGPIDPGMVREAEMLAEPLPETHDVWVSGMTDHHYFVHEVQHALAVGGRPILLQARLHLAPFSHVVYRLP